VVVFGKSVPECMVDDCIMPVSDVGKCLENWCRGDMFATRYLIRNRLLS
jgi:hypothetical protein